SQSRSGVRRANAAARVDPASAAGLYEGKRHPIRLADRNEALAIDRAAAQGGRQRPDAVWIVLGVTRVGVRLAARNKAEPGRTCVLDHELLRNIATRDDAIERSARKCPMLFDAKHPARLECGIK